MKIIYTKKFKETLSQPWSYISLGKVKLRGGTNTGLTRQDISKVIDDNLLEDFPWKESTQGTYTAEMIRLPEGGIQIYLQIPDEDQSFHTETFFYQVVMFFYTDLLTDTESLAFVCYEEIDYGSQEISPNDPVTFTGLKLVTRRNIITIPGFKWVGNIKFSQSEVTKYLESIPKTYPLQEDNGLVSRDSWDAWMVDSFSTPTLTPWMETTFINKYGIKIY